MPVVHTTIRGLDAELRRHFANDQRKLNQAAVRTARYGMVYARRLARVEGVEDLGTYIDGWHVAEVPGYGAGLRNDAPHAAAVEHGRRPGSAPPPLSVIRAWAARKLMVTDEGAVYAIARAIGRRGIRPKFILRRTNDRMRVVFREQILKALAEP